MQKTKLKHYGIRGIANEWFKSYLFDRKQFVSINGHVSNKASVKYGVPQGSVFGPLLFLIYINDLNHAIKFLKVHHFADYTNLVQFSKSANNLKLSRKRLYPSKSVKYLGLKIDENLNWRDQTYDIATKLNKANALLCKIRNYVLIL